MNSLRLRAFSLILTGATAWTFCGELRAQTEYRAMSGKITFRVGSNIPFLKVSGSSSALIGSGAAAVAENSATIRNLRFEVDPETFKTGINLRDAHMNEKVFTAADGTRPKIALRADRFVAKLNPQNGRWEGTLEAQLTMRGVTRPVPFHATAERKGEGAIVSADGMVKISDFGVRPISNAGVTVNDEVTVIVSNLVIAPGTHK